MAMNWSRRSILGAAMAATVPVVAGSASADEKAGPAVKGKLTDESLGNLLKAMGFDAQLEEKRYDFVFKATIEKEEWDLSMSAVLSQDGSSIWVMAWLDELPKSAADVPRTALLRLLSDNDKLGKGKFFTYIASNRRFVLQRVVPNEAISSEKFRAVLDDIGQSVVATHPHWSVSNWSAPSTEDPAQTAKTGTQVKGSLPVSTNTTAGNPPKTTGPARTATNDSKFGPATK